MQLSSFPDIAFHAEIIYYFVAIFVCEGTPAQKYEKKHANVKLFHMNV